jgi:hypothetical protein
MLTGIEPLSQRRMTRTSSVAPGGRRRRVTLTLPNSLLERLRNAVYWTGHGPLARLIVDAVTDAVVHLEESNGQPFPQRLAPLRPGRPRTKTA